MAMDEDLKMRVRADLESFLKGRDYYHRLGRVWRRSYLLYGPPGTGKSTFVAAMAKFLCYDIYDVDLSHVSAAGDADGTDLKGLLLRCIFTLLQLMLCSFLMTHQGLALHSLRIGINALAWTDGDSVNKVIPFCGSIIVLAIVTSSVELREIVSKDLFLALIQALSLESNAMISSDLLGLCREIYVYLADRDPAPRQVLLSLHSITSNDLLAFDDALTKTTSPKEQKQLLKGLLLSATGNKLRALAALRTTNIITNVTARTRSSASNSGPNTEEDSIIGLAAIT